MDFVWDIISFIIKSKGVAILYVIFFEFFIFFLPKCIPKIKLLLYLFIRGDPEEPY